MAALTETIIAEPSGPTGGLRVHLPKISLSPSPEVVRHNRGLVGLVKSPTKAEARHTGRLRSLALPLLSSPNGRTNVTAQSTEGQDGLNLSSSLDIDPHPPVEGKARGAMRVLHMRSFKGELRWKKLRTIASPSKVKASMARSPAKANLRSPLRTSKDQQERRLAMLRSALEEQSYQTAMVQSALTLFELERQGRIEMMAEEQEQRSLCLAQLVERFPQSSSRGPGKDILQAAVIEQEATVRGAMSAAYLRGTEDLLSLRLDGALSLLADTERSKRSLVLQNEMDRRSILLGIWLGIDVSRMPVHDADVFELLAAEEDFRRHAIATAEHTTHSTIQQERDERAKHLSERLQEEKSRAFNCKRNVLSESEELRRDSILAEEQAERKLLFNAWLSKETRTALPKGGPAPQAQPREAPPAPPPFRPANAARRYSPPAPYGGPHHAAGSSTTTAAAQPSSGASALHAARESAIAALLISEDCARGTIASAQRDEWDATALAWRRAQPAVPLAPVPPNELRARNQMRPGSAAAPDKKIASLPVLVGMEDHARREIVRQRKAAWAALCSDFAALTGKRPPGSPSGKHSAAGAGGPKVTPTKAAAAAVAQRPADPQLQRALMRVLARELALLQQQEALRRRNFAEAQQMESHQLSFRIWRAAQENIPCDEQERVARRMDVAFQEELLERRKVELQEQQAYRTFVFNCFTLEQRTRRG